MLDIDQPCKWTIRINDITEFDFYNSFSNFTFELKVILKVTVQSKVTSKIENQN